MKKRFKKLFLYRSLINILEKKQKLKGNSTVNKLIDRLYQVLNESEPDYDSLFDGIKTSIKSSPDFNKRGVVFNPKQHSNGRRILIRISVAATVAVAVFTLLFNYGERLSVLLKGHQGNSNYEIVAKLSQTYDRSKAFLVIDDSLSTKLTDDSVAFTPTSKIIFNLTNTRNNKKEQLTLKEKITVNAVIVPKGSEFSVTLPDGSKAFLNSNSKLTFPSKFEKDKRVVHLEGEAMFEITKSGIPFSVVCGNSITTVLGTVFNIKCKEGTDEITLKSGSVKVSNTLKNNAQIIVPEEQAIVSENTINVSKVDVNEVFAWTKGQFYFRNIPLEEIANKLYDWYDVEFKFANDQIKSVPFTGMINRNSNLNTIFELFEMSYNLSFSVNDSCVVINNQYNQIPQPR